MASPQPDTNYMRIARDLDEAWTAASLTRAEHKTLRAVVRCSYGFNRKTTDGLASMRSLAEMTGLHRSNVCPAVAGLVRKGLLLVVAPGKPPSTAAVYEVQKDYEQWSCLPDGWAPRFGANVRLDRNVRDSGMDTENRTDMGTGIQTDMGTENRDTEKRVEKRVESSSSARPFGIDPADFRAPLSGWDWHSDYLYLGGSMTPKPAHQSRLIAAARWAGQDDARLDTVQDFVKRAGSKDRPLSWFLACISDDGSMEPKKQQREEIDFEAIAAEVNARRTP